MYARAIVVCSTILLISTLGYPARDPTDSTREFSEHLDALLPALLDKHHVVGASVALVQDGEVTFTHGYGYADDGTKNKVTPVTLFNVGSISKTVTAWGILKLVEQRRIDLDAPVNKYLKRWHVTSSGLCL
jgi:CubicO group peptidase (beta-lactamase class C family)